MNSSPTRLMVAIAFLAGLMTCNVNDCKTALDSGQVGAWLSGASKIPSPAKVVSTSDWYLLNHVTGKLIEYDHISGHFKPMLAESWSIHGTTYTFKLKPNLVFSDGTPISTEDVAASLKFLISQQSSTHFPVWQFFDGLDKEPVENSKSKFKHIRVIDDQTISITLKSRMQSFFLLLTSPEGGIWKSDDIQRFERGLQPKAFSGPYFVKQLEPEALSMVLERNEQSLPADWYPSRPKLIRVFYGNLEQVAPKFKSGEVDIYFDAARPFASYDYEPQKYQVAFSAPATILYLFRVQPEKGIISRKFVEQLWADFPKDVVPATTFLPFTSRKGIDRESYLNCLPREVAARKVIRIGVLSPYFTDGLLNHLEKRGIEAGHIFEFIKLNSEQWFKAFENLNSKEFDFILSAYVASERFPSVQLRYLLEGYKVPFEISELDTPDWKNEHSALLLNVQKYILEQQLVIPLYFVKNQIRHSSKVDIGDQPMMDSDIQLWRIKKR